MKSVLFSAVLWLAACGQKINSIQDKSQWNRTISQYSIESYCQNKPGQNSNLYNDVMNLYQKVVQSGKLTSSGIDISNYYDYRNPMIVSEERIKNLENEIQNELNFENVNASQFDQLYEFANRFEGMRCQFNNLKSKFKSDLRPYLYFVHECKNNSNVEDCTADEIERVYAENFVETKKEFIKVCQSFEKSNVCEMQFKLKKQQNQITNLTANYLKRFAKERFETLFELRNNHQQFNCQKNEERVVLNVDIVNSGWDPNIFTILVQALESTWTNKSFQIKFNIVNSATSNSISIIPIELGVSHVLDNDNKKIYLNKNLDFMNLRKVVAHEFGHILGFPDCYIEFFDEANNELVYYELSKNNTNLMCSLKTGAIVPDSYFEQLKQNSCKF